MATQPQCGQFTSNMCQISECGTAANLTCIHCNPRLNIVSTIESTGRISEGFCIGVLRKYGTYYGPNNQALEAWWLTDRASRLCLTNAWIGLLLKTPNCTRSRLFFKWCHFASCHKLHFHTHTLTNRHAEKTIKSQHFSRICSHKYTHVLIHCDALMVWKCPDESSFCPMLTLQWAKMIRAEFKWRSLSKLPKGSLRIQADGMNGNAAGSLSEPLGSLTGVKRARDKSEQVLCELEDLPLAPFPATHLFSWEGRCLERSAQKQYSWLQGLKK